MIKVWSVNVRSHDSVILELQKLNVRHSCIVYVTTRLLIHGKNFKINSNRCKIIQLINKLYDKKYLADIKFIMSVVHEYK